MKSIEKNDIEKISTSLKEKKKFDFFKEWICFNSGGSIIFIDNKQWRKVTKNGDIPYFLSSEPSQQGGGGGQNPGY